MHQEGQVAKNFEIVEDKEWEKVLIPNRDSPNGYFTVMPAELQSVTLSH